MRVARSVCLELGATDDWRARTQVWRERKDGGCRQVVKAAEGDTLGIVRQVPVTGPLPA